MINSLKQLDWGGWFYSLGVAVIGGGSGAVGSAIGATWLDPAKFNLVHPSAILQLMLITFCVNAVLSLFLFLKQSPLPAVESTVVTQTTQTIVTTPKN